MTDKNYLRILIADDHSLFRTGLISMFNEDNNILVVGEAENGKQVISKYLDLKPNVVLLDIFMPEMSGFETLKRLLEIDAHVKVLFLSMYDSEEYIYNTFKTGGFGLVNKNILKGELIFAINKVSNGHYYFGPSWDNERLQNLIERNKRSEKLHIPKLLSLLTRREKDILRLIARGLTSQEISDELNLSKRTIDFHRSNIMQKMNVRNLPELIKFSIELSTDGKIPH